MESVNSRNERLARMGLEAANLKANIAKATTFVEGPFFNTLDELDQSLLINQVLAMQSYLGILNLRIERLKGLIDSTQSILSGRG